MCTTPVDGFDCCWRCQRHQRVAGLADLVVPLIGRDAPSVAPVRRYKNDPVRSVRAQHSVIINWLVWLGITRHERCIAAAVGCPAGGHVLPHRHVDDG